MLVFFDKNERALKHLRDVFIQRAKMISKSRTGASLQSGGRAIGLGSKSKQADKSDVERAKTTAKMKALLPLQQPYELDPDPTSWMDLLLQADQVLDKHKDKLPSHKRKTKKTRIYFAAVFEQDRQTVPATSAWATDSGMVPAWASCHIF